MNLFDDVEALAASGYLFRITDNGGATADRYTVVFCDGDYLGMSGDPSNPQGVSLWGEGIDVASLAERVENGEEIDLTFGDLPDHIRSHVLYRINQGFADFVQSEEAADSRGAAQEFEGLLDQVGVCIYRAPAGFMVRDAEHDDHGPFKLYRDAVLSTLPDEHTLSGPEYQSPLEVGSLEPGADTAADLLALQRRNGAREAGYEVKQLAYGGAGLGSYWQVTGPDGSKVDAADALDFSAGDIDAWNIAGADWAGS